jgi:hypothetical protein
MSSETTPADLLDLKMLPAWASEPARPNEYANFEGEEFERPDRRGPRPDRDRQQRSRRPQDRPAGDRPERRGQAPRRPRDGAPQRRDFADRGGEARPREALPPVTIEIRFLPHAGAFNNVVEQIKSGPVAYSVFALGRLFLDKPERYDVRLTSTEDQPLYQLGETGPVALDQRILESNAFAGMIDEFFSVEITQTEPLKGSFTNVARCRLSGLLLGPTNYHSYQPQLRSLYEQRFSRRMSFADYQKQIEIVNDPAVVEQWKEQARSVTKWTTKNEEPPVTFASQAEAERHFRQKYLPGLLHTATTVTITGVASRALPDRRLNRAIEEAWVRETRSPSNMMQELASGLRQAGLNIFRHRRGMLFVSPIRARAFGHERDAVSASVRWVLEKISATPGINRKQLAEEVASGATESADVDRAKLTLASDLRWLISEGYVIEFNDGSLDLPRTKLPSAAAVAVAPASAEASPAVVPSGDAEVAQPVVEPPTVEDVPAVNTSASTPAQAEIVGG